MLTDFNCNTFASSLCILYQHIELIGCISGFGQSPDFRIPSDKYAAGRVIGSIPRMYQDAFIGRDVKQSWQVPAKLGRPIIYHLIFSVRDGGFALYLLFIAQIADGVFQCVTEKLSVYEQSAHRISGFLP